MGIMNRRWICADVLLLLMAWACHGFPLAGHWKEVHHRAFSLGVSTTPPPTTTMETLVPDDDKDKSTDRVFRPWPFSRIESNGDYTGETWLEEYISGPLYSRQDQLPSLPVPPIQDSVDKVIESTVPLASDTKETQDFLQAANDFASQAAVLQDRLLQRAAAVAAHSSSSSWLQAFWQRVGYLQSNTALPWISYFLLVPDDNDNVTMTQRGAALLSNLATMRQAICAGHFPAERIAHGSDRDQPLCSTGFKYLFHACRIPQKQQQQQQDSFFLYDPSRYSHCIVACHGQLYKMEFCQKGTGDPLPLAVLEDGLEQCVALAAAAADQQQQHDDYPSLSWLTCQERDTWATDRQDLLNVGGRPMAQALEDLQSAAFVLHLDVDETPQTWTDRARTFWQRPRWYDKSMQLICTQNAQVAYLGEHSLSDASPVVPILSKIFKTPYRKLQSKQGGASSEASMEKVSVQNVFAHCWEKNPDLLQMAQEKVERAREWYTNKMSQYDIQVEYFQDFGKKALHFDTVHANDFVQMAMQLAAGRFFGEPAVGTYEAALTRTFLHGRTETVRPVSRASQALVQAMDDKDTPVEEKYELFMQAMNRHNEFQVNATQGMGIDRHLFGLSQMLKPDEKAPDMLEDPLFGKSQEWRLSTSAVIFTPGFGPSTNDGIGVGYRIDGNSFMFICSGQPKNVSLEGFRRELRRALLDLKGVLNEAEHRNPE